VKICFKNSPRKATLGSTNQNVNELLLIGKFNIKVA